MTYNWKKEKHIEIICVVCNGSGKILFEGKEDECPCCDGKGYSYES